MSSPDSEILSKIITDEIRATYLTHIDSYHKKNFVLASNLNRLKAIDQEREQLSQIIQQQKQELDTHIISISNLLKTSLADNSKPRSPNYTDLHRIKNHNEDLNIIQAYKQDPVLQRKTWKSKAFYDALCAQYPVFDDLGDNTFKRVTLVQAWFYWKNKVSNLAVTPQDSDKDQDDPGSSWLNSKAELD
jgi:hypothetical protein